MDTQAELEKELKRLQLKYGACIKEDELPFEKNAELKGEVNKVDHKLMVYEHDLPEALHVLRHEFFEAAFDTLIQPYIEVFNHIQRGYERAFMATQYSRKESLIEKFVAQEEKSVERGENA